MNIAYFDESVIRVTKITQTDFTEYYVTEGMISESTAESRIQHNFKNEKKPNQVMNIDKPIYDLHI